jgi:hypothetical protein
MMKFTVALRLRVKVKGKCPKHPRYNPELGRGAIKGTCRTCLELFELTEARDQLRAAAAKLEELAKPWLVERRSRIKASPPAGL